MKLLRGLSVALSILTLTALVSHADDITWTNAAGGSFHVAENWDPNQVPYTNDTAVFELTDGPYTVTWEENVTNHTQIVRAGTVTFDLKGYTYSLNKHSTNTIGTTEDTTLVTFTNGTVQRLNAEFTGSTRTERFYLRGNGTTLFLRNAKHHKVAYYHWADPDTKVIIDGPSARLETLGYSTQTGGDLIVTNGGFFSAEPGLNLSQHVGIIHISGPGYRSNFSIRSDGVHADSSILMDNGAEVRYDSARKLPTSISGTITLDDARWHDRYPAGGYPEMGWLILDGETALLQGTGNVEMKGIVMNGGTISPGCTNRIGVLTFIGHVTNVVATSRFEMELAGSERSNYDRIVLVDGTRGNGYLYAGGVLNVTALNDYEPVRKKTFKLIDAVAIEFEFDEINLPKWRGIWDTSELYTAGEITFISQRGTVIVVK